MALDPAWAPVIGTVAGTIAGAALSIVGNFVIQHNAHKRERELWDRQEAAKQQERRETAEAVERTHIHNLYQDAVRAVSACEHYVRRERRPPPDHSREAAVFDEVCRAVAPICVRHPGVLDGALVMFRSEFPDDSFGYLHNLDEKISTLIQLEPMLNNRTFTIPPQKNEQPDITKLTMQISRAYQRGHFEKHGSRLPDSFSFECGPLDMTESQRQLLLDASPRSTMHAVTPSFTLPFPGLNSNKKTITTSEKWQASLDPTNMPLNGILKVWENEYRARLKELEAEIAAKQPRGPEQPSSV